MLIVLVEQQQQFRPSKAKKCENVVESLSWFGAPGASALLKD